MQRPSFVARSSAKGDGEARAEAGVTGVAALVGTPVYTALEVGELLIILMLLDAAFSGDWSRIGAITTGGTVEERQTMGGKGVGGVARKWDRSR
jgi:hypothetical protein